MNLKKLLEPKFNVGDRVFVKTILGYTHTKITEVKDSSVGYFYLIENPLWDRWVEERNIRKEFKEFNE